MQNFVFNVIVTTDTYDHALRVLQAHIDQSEPVFEAGAEIDHQIEIDWEHPTGTTVEGALLGGN